MSAGLHRWAWGLAGLLLSLGCGEGPSGAGDGEPLLFRPTPGTFREAFEWSALSTLPDATIHYTLDGSLPTPQSPRLDAPIPIDRTTQVRAIAVRAQAGAELERTKVVSGNYLALGVEAETFASNLPLVVVHMLGRGAPPQDSRDYLPAGMQLFEPTAGVTALGATPTVDSRIGIKVRGNSTRWEAKHSFSLELWDEEDQDDHARPLLGMPADADWALYAPYNWDRAHVRNALVYQLSNDMGRYAARTRFVELFLAEGDGPVDQNDYRGVHLLMERLKASPDRIAIDRLKAGEDSEPEVSGGYIVKVDHLDPGDRPFGAGGLELSWVEPKTLDVTPAQQTYLKNYFGQVARAAAAADGRDPDSGAHYERLIDVGSFIDHHILNTYTKNPDALRLSAYFHKPRGGPLRAGPVWDFDRTLGSDDERDDDPAGWSATGDGTDLFGYPLWRDLFAQQAFQRAYVDRFRALLTGPLSTARVHGYIEAFGAQLAQAAERDAERWPGGAPRGGDYQNELDALKTWTAERAIWIEDHLDEILR